MNDSKRKFTLSLWGAILLLNARIVTCVYGAGFILWYALADGLRDRSGTPLGADFLNVFAAGLLVDGGQSAEVYDWVLHGQKEQIVAGYPAPYFGWHYPPPFLLIAGILASLPYLWSFALYSAVGFLAYLAVLRRLVPQMGKYIWLLIAFPGVFANIINGQNGFITTSLFGAGFIWLETQPFLAGTMFGLLIYKPQFFVLIPLMLAIGRYGRALLATCLTASLCLGLSWIGFGNATWLAFLSSLKLTRHIILEQGVTGWQKIQSVFSWVRMWGGDIENAYILQGVVAAGALACAAFVWHRKAALPTRAAALCAAMLLTTPYLLDYDLVILAVPLALLTAQGIADKFVAYEKPLLGCLWLLPLLARSIGVYHIPLTPPLLMILMGICLIRASSKVENK